MRALFVDDEPLVLEGIERLLFTLDVNVDAEFATSAPSALALMERNPPFDLIVTDMRMPGMDGAELLRAVQQKHPLTMRVVLSGQTDESAAARAVTVAHQLLSKPCNVASLRAVIERATALRQVRIKDVTKEVVGRLSALPTVPELYAKVRMLAEDERATPEKVAALLERDPAMVARLLQLANSSFFAPLSEITSVPVAVARLGLRAVSNMVLGESLYRQFQAAQGGRVTALQGAGYRRGALAARLVGSQSAPDAAATALSAGLLSPIGQLVLLGSDWDAQVAREERALAGADLPELERAEVGADHAEVGAYLLASWGLPAEIVAAVGNYRRPGALSRKAVGPSEALYVAAALLDGRPLDQQWLVAGRNQPSVPMWQQMARLV